MFPNQVSQMMLTASDIKQFVYCPRIPYFRYVLPVPSVPTEQMLAGRERHIRIARLEKRRKTRKYQLKEGRKIFRQSLTSSRLGLTGSLDMLIESGGNFYPVEYKYSEGEPALHHRYQLTAYALLVEDFCRRIVRSGYIYMLRAEQVFPIEITESKKQRVKAIMRDIRAMVRIESMPSPTPHRERCYNCEFRLYCADTV